MDLNELYFRHQIALMREAETASPGERQRHCTAAAGLAARIGVIQQRSGALAAALLSPACRSALA